jgi:Flp pilus assembly protein CpaB
MPSPPHRPGLDVVALDDLRAAARRLIRRHRRALVAGLLVLAALSSLNAVGGPSADTRAVVVAAADLPAGHALDDSDITVVDVPVDAVADDAHHDSTSLVGRRVATAVSAREPLTPARLIDATGASAGTVVSAIRLADPQVAELLSTGDVVDVLAARGTDLATADAESDAETTGSAAAQVVASAVRVIGIPQARGSSGSSLLGDTAALESSGLVMLEVDAATAARLAGAAATSRLSVAVRGE